MSLDIEILRTLATRGRLRATAKHLKSMPLAQRSDMIEAIQHALTEPEASALRFNWPLRARNPRRPTSAPPTPQTAPTP